MLKFKLFLTGKKGLSALLGFSEAAELVSGVCIGLDKSLQCDYSNEMIEYCRSNNIPYSVFPEALTCSFDYIIAAGWQRMIKDVSPRQLIIFHDSLLPRYRGFAPLVTALLNQEEYIGLTVLTGEDEFDKGDIYIQKKIINPGFQSIAEAIDTIAELYKIAVQDLIVALKNNFIPIKQDEKKASYSLWLDEEDYHIDWSKSSSEIIRHIQYVGFPYKCAYSLVDGEKIRISAAVEFPDVKIERRTPGKTLFLIEDKPVVVCGSGLIKIIDYFFDDSEKTQLKFRSRFK